MSGKSNPPLQRIADRPGGNPPPLTGGIPPSPTQPRPLPSVVICLRPLGLLSSGHRKARPKTPIAMANPRYVDRDDVDSSAMLGAAAHSLHLDRQLWEAIGVWGRLPITLHGAGPLEAEELTIPPGFYVTKCMEGSNCARCTTGRGGYKFRWFSPLWAQAYLAGAREGAWMPGQPETRYRRQALAQQAGNEGAILDETNRKSPMETAREVATAAPNAPSPEEWAARLYDRWGTVIGGIANATCEVPGAAPLDPGTVEQLLLRTLDAAVGDSASVADPPTAVRTQGPPSPPS